MNYIICSPSGINKETFNKALNLGHRLLIVSIRTELREEDDWWYQLLRKDDLMFLADRKIPEEHSNLRAIELWQRVQEETGIQMDPERILSGHLPTMRQEAIWNNPNVIGIKSL